MGRIDESLSELIDIYGKNIWSGINYKKLILSRSC